MERKTKTANADRCKRYRDKNPEEYKINDDALRKNPAKLLIKSNRDAYEKHKSQEREKKRLPKHKGFCNISTPFGPRAILNPM